MLLSEFLNKINQEVENNPSILQLPVFGYSPKNADLIPIDEEYPIDIISDRIDFNLKEE